jgi:hypothetical protein
VAFFPVSTHPYQRRLTERDWDHRGPSAFRKLAFSVLDMAVITGVLLRLGRAFLLAQLLEFRIETAQKIVHQSGPVSRREPERSF